MKISIYIRVSTEDQAPINFANGKIYAQGHVFSGSTKNPGDTILNYLI